MKKSNRHIIVSHDADLDGVASAVLLFRYIKQFYAPASVTVRFSNYDDVKSVVEESVQNCDFLWIADLSIRDLSLVDVLAKSKVNTFFFDHHADTSSFASQIKTFATVFFDDSGSKCAADLIWDFISPVFAEHIKGQASVDEFESMAYLVRATHSRDLWVNDVQEGIDLSAVIAMIGPDKSLELLTEDIHRVHRANFTDLMEFCVDLDESLMEKAKTAAKATAIRYFYYPDSPKSRAAGVSVIAAVTSGCQSDVGHMFLSEHPRAIVGLINLDKVGISFRTNQETIAQLGFGVNDIARTIEGGGGHPFAAGAPASEEILTGGSRALLNFICGCIDKKIFETEGIKAR